MCKNAEGRPRPVAKPDRALIGEIEEDLDGEIEYETLKAAPLLPVSH